MSNAHFGGENNKRRDIGVDAEVDVLGVLDRVSDSVLILDTDARIIYANDAAHANCRTLGYDGELVGEIFWDASPRANESQLVTEIPQSLATQEPVEFREHYEPLNVWFETHVHPAEDSVAVYSRDISDEVRRGEDLERFETICRTMQDGVFILDETDSFDLVNEAFARMVGYDEDEADALIGKHVSAVMGEEVAEQIMGVRDGLNHSDTQRFETTVEQQETPVPVEVQVSSSPIDGEYTGMVCVLHDLSQRKQLEAEKDETKRERDEALDRVDDSILSLDKEWRFTYANRVTKKFAQILRDGSAEQTDLLGKNIWDEFPEAKETGFPEKVEDAFETQQVQTTREYVPGLERWFESAIFPSESGVTMYSRDITKQVALEADRDEKNRVLDRVDDMVWGVDNDWRFTFANEASITFAGRPRENVIGAVLWDVFPDAKDSEFGAMVLESMETGEPGRSIEFSPEYGIWVEARAFPSETGMTFYSRDVTEQKLLEAELEDIFDRITDGFYALDNDWNIVFWNAAMEERTGRTSQEVMGKDILDLFPRVFEGKMESNYRRAFETQQPSSFETYLDTFDVWIEVSLYPSESGLSVYSSDITERKTHEREIEDTKSRLELALDGTNTGTWEWVMTDDRLIWQGKACEFFGVEGDQFVGAYDDFASRVHPDDLPNIEQGIENSIELSKPYINEYRIVHPNGDVRWGESRARLYKDESGNPLRMVGTVTDITERKTSERELEETKSRLELALDGTNTGIWEWDITDGTVVWEGKTHEIFGVQPGEFGGTFEDFAQVVHPDDLSVLEQGLSESLDGKTPYIVEFRFTLPSGEVRWAESRATIYENEAGESERMVGVVSDITERREREQELEEAKTRLELALSGTNTGIWEWDIETSSIIWGGETNLLFGIEPHEFDETYEDFISRVHPDDVPVVEQATKEALEESKPYNVELRIVQPDGDVRWSEARAQVVEDESGEPMGLLGLAIDITERKAREQALQDTEMRLRTVVENAPLVLFMWDSERTITLSEGHGLSQLGLEPGQVVGESVYDLYADHPDIIELVEQVSEGEKTHEFFDIEELTFEGWFEPMYDDEGTLTHVIGVAVDVTDRIQNERALRDSENRLRSVVENAPVAQTVFDADGVITLSEGRVELLGRERGEAVGKSLFDIYGEHPHIPEHVELALTGERVHQTFEVGDLYLETWFEPIFDDDGSLVNVIKLSADVTDRLLYEQTLTALNRSSQQLLAAETKTEVANVVVDTGTDVLGLTPVKVLLFDKQSNALRPVGGATAEGTADDTVSYEPGSAYWNEFFDIDDGDEHVTNEICVPIGTHGLFVAGDADHKQTSEEVVELAELLAATAEATLDRVAREESLLDRKQALREQTKRLERLHEINEQLRSIEHVLVMAEDRSEIERGICQRFIEPDRFAFAWFGAVDNGTVTPTRWAGAERGYLPEIEALADETEPATIAAKTLEAVVISPIAERIHEEPWRKEALASGYQSVMSVPLVYDGRIHGVLTVYATDNDAFDRLSRTVIEDLGRTIAYALNSVETKRGFLTDRVVELALRTERSRDPLAQLAARTGASIQFNGLVHGTEQHRIFFSATGVSAEDIVAESEQISNLESVRVISGDDDGGTFEAVSSSSLFAGILAERGAIPREVESSADETVAIIELPYHTDVSGFVESLRSRFRDIELTARRDRERAPLTKERFKEEFKSTVTPRQLEVIQTAYFSGYFNSPRTTNGQDVAAMLSITQPTFNYHLRAGERTLLEMLFDD